MAEKARFYNAGDRIDEKFIYTLPDGHDVHCNAHQRVRLERQAFTEINLELAIGPAVVRLRTDDDIRRRFGRRGVVQVDRNRRPEAILESEPLATSDEEAIEKGKKLWAAYLKAVVQDFEREVAEARAAGRPGRTPAGFTRRAYELLGFDVPGEEKFRQATATDEMVANLAKQVEELSRKLAAKEQPEPSLPLEGRKK